MKIELSKDEIETIDWAVSYLIEDIKNNCLEWLDLPDKDFTDLKNIENKFNMLCDKMDKENEAQEIS